MSRFAPRWRRDWTPAPGAPGSRKLLKKTVGERCADLAAYKHPRKIEVWPDPLERGSTQKVRRHLYQGRLDPRRADAPAAR